MTKIVDELLHKRIELADRQAAIKAEISKIDQDLNAIDRVVTLIDPGYHGPAPSYHRKSASARGTGFSRGELSNGVLEVLRDNGSMTAAECAERLAALKGIQINSCPRLKPNVATTLIYLAKKNRVRRVHDSDGRTVHWQVAR